MAGSIWNHSRMVQTSLQHRRALCWKAHGRMTDAQPGPPGACHWVPPCRPELKVYMMMCIPFSGYPAGCISRIKSRGGACTDLQPSSSVHNDSIVVFSPGFCQPLLGNLCRLCIHPHLKHRHLRQHPANWPDKDPNREHCCRLLTFRSCIMCRGMGHSTWTPFSGLMSCSMVTRPVKSQCRPCVGAALLDRDHDLAQHSTDGGSSFKTWLRVPKILLRQEAL